MIKKEMSNNNNNNNNNNTKKEYIQLEGRDRDFFIGFLGGMSTIEYTIVKTTTPSRLQVAALVDETLRMYHQKGLEEDEIVLIQNKRIEQLMDSLTPDEKMEIMLGKQGKERYDQWKIDKLKEKSSTPPNSPIG